MSALPRTRLGLLAAAAATFAATCLLAALARAQGPPTPGGTVPSMLALSLSEPRPFGQIGHSGLYTSVIRAKVTATDVPVRLSLADGEAITGPRRGHLVGGRSILSPALEAAAGAGPFRSLDAAVPVPLRTWGRPLNGEKVKIRLRQRAPDAAAVRNRHKLLLVTLTAAGP